MLSHPDLKAFAEDLFVPVFVQNNTTGDEAQRTCSRFDEPAWNNPVVRAVDAEGNDLATRLSSDWTVRGVAKLMVDALRSTGRPCPAELLLLARS